MIRSLSCVVTADGRVGWGKYVREMWDSFLLEHEGHVDAEGHWS